MKVSAYRLMTGAAIAAILVLLAVLSLSRDYFGFGTETDYLGTFMAEAARFQRGEPLQLLYHPPFYSVTIGLVQVLTDDWFVTGRLVSFAAAALVLITSFLFFEFTWSRAAAAGALVALAASPRFLIYGTLATSDLFFFALYTSSLLFALLAARRRSSLMWVIAGMTVGAAVLSRTNGVSLLLILVLPWFGQDEPLKRRAGASFNVVLGFAVPVLAWVFYASLTGAPLAPVNTHINLAWRFFPPEGVAAWSDGLGYVRQTFENAWQVLAHDPASMLRQYLAGLYKLPMRLAERDALLAYPLNLLLLPAILYLLFAARDRWLFYAMFVALGQVALMGFNIFLARYYLFLVPLIGAAMGHMAWRMFTSTEEGEGTSTGRGAARLLLAGAVLLGLFNGIREAKDFVAKSGAELRESIPAVTAIVPRGSIIVARKQVIAFYTDSESAGMPAGSSLDDLRRHVEAQGSDRAVFVYYGSAEKGHRPEYSDLGASPEAIPWLMLEASSAEPGNWYLFRFKRSALKLK